MRPIFHYPCFRLSPTSRYTDLGGDALIEGGGVEEEGGSLFPLFLFFLTLSISEIDKLLALYNTTFGHKGKKH